MSRKPWSISTTVRNPARLRDFVLVLAEMEGTPFDANAQCEFQIRLIKNRLYRPTLIPEKYRAYFEDPDAEIPYAVAKDVFMSQNYEDPAMRGRQSANPLNKLGFAIAVQKLGSVRITKAGRMLIDQPEKVSDLLFASLLKLQYPNPLSQRDFTARQGFNIVPFLGCLALLQKLKELEISHLNKDEFCLFVPALIDASQIEEYTRRILTFRQSSPQQKAHLSLDWVQEFYGETTITKNSKKFKNLYEYGDNAMRYFRFTRYLLVVSDPLRGDWQINIEPSRSTEVELLLSSFGSTPRHFSSVSEYMEYLGDPDQPLLPWKQINELKQVAISLQTELLTLMPDSSESRDLLEVNLNLLSKDEIERLIERMRTEIRRRTQQAQRHHLRLSVERLEDHAKAITQLNRRKGVQPEEFEQLLYQVLVALDDEVWIQPNYPTDDYGNPISHAPGGKADIECLYSNFAMIVEVTLDTGNFQWVREGQPVMRHLREFEERAKSDAVYCLFIAPRIHDDTYSQFWFAVKYEYKGTRQKILPLSASQFRVVIETLRSWIEKHQKMDHRLLQRLIDDSLAVDHINGYHEWRRHIQQTLDQWAAEVRNQ